MCPFCIATATLMVAVGAVPIGGLATVLGLKIRSARRGSAEKNAAGESSDQNSSQLEDRRAS